jgi:hypothetical protein
LIGRAIAEAVSHSDLCRRLNESYPFDESPECRRIWEEALAAQGVAIKKPADRLLGESENKQARKAATSKPR